MSYAITVIAALIGSLITLAGLAACFLFGLIPILNAIDTNRTVSTLAGLFLLSVLAWILGLRTLFRHDRETWILDETTRTWIRLP